MEPEGSFPCSQEPFTGPCPERNRSSPYHTIPFHPIPLRSILILSTHLQLGLPSGLLLAFSPMCIDLPIRATCPALLIVLDLIVVNTWRRIQVKYLSERKIFRAKFMERNNTFYIQYIFSVKVTVLEINTQKGEMEHTRIVNVRTFEAVGIEVHVS
jgi:hypothetical protein